MLKKIVLVTALAVASFVSVGAVARGTANRSADTSTVTMKFPPTCNPWDVCY